MSEKDSADLLELLKAVADEKRLTILQLLDAGEHTVGELAARLEIGEPTTSHHLAKLRTVGLVSLRMAGNQRYYCLRKAGLDHFKQLVTTIEQAPPEPEPVVTDESWIDALGWSAEDQKVLRDYTVDGRITQVPMKQKKLLVILRWLATLFQPETFYTEKEVNAIIKAVHEDDYVGLRRDLIDMGYLRRERGGGRYWLAPVEEA